MVSQAESDNPLDFRRSFPRALINTTRLLNQRNVVRAVDHANYGGPQAVSKPRPKVVPTDRVHT